MTQNHVCPWWLCYTFDNPLRRLFHDPEKILLPFVSSGDRVIDIGAGMGYFSIPLAKLVGPDGHVTSIDIQKPMLLALTRRAGKSDVSERLTPYLASSESLGEHEPADFILAFWMVHEVPDQKKFLNEVFHLLKPKGNFLVVEPKFHVSKNNFSKTIALARNLGFAIEKQSGIRFSRSALLVRDDECL